MLQIVATSLGLPDEPSIRDKSHYDRLWYGVRNNFNDTIGSDHAPHFKENKDKDIQILLRECRFKLPIPVMLNHINDGKLSLNQLMNFV